MLTSVCVSRIYHCSERKKNAGTGNFVYVGENTALYEHSLRFLKKGKASFITNFEKAFKF